MEEGYGKWRDHTVRRGWGGEGEKKEKGVKDGEERRGRSRERRGREKEGGRGGGRRRKMEEEGGGERRGGGGEEERREEGAPTVLAVSYASDISPREVVKSPIRSWLPSSS